MPPPLDLTPRLGDRQLYDRGAASAIACWEHIARGTAGAAIVRASGVAAAVFPSGPERDVYNNALLERDLSTAGRERALAAMEEAYTRAGVERFAAWVHESDVPLLRELASRGYGVSETTRAMGMELGDLDVGAVDATLGEAGWPEYLGHLRSLGLPPALLANVDPGAFHVLAAWLDREAVATGFAFDHDGDAGIYNVSTFERARRRGLGTALTRGLLHAATRRGCVTVSLQSTPMAERVYAAVGFRDLGRIVELMPPAPRRPAGAASGRSAGQRRGTGAG
jgi:ribosomal protein S18 acetylase RimI-like enzyme